MATLLMPLPDSDFDPTESGVPWRTMRDHGHRVVFATPSGRTARADPELIAWRLTRHYLGDYYRTYPTTVEDEVRSALARPEDFITGPLPLRRDSAVRLGVGFTVRDGDYLSARWPGDAHRFAAEFAAMIGQGPS